MHTTFHLQTHRISKMSHYKSTDGVSIALGKVRMKYQTPPTEKHPGLVQGFTSGPTLWAEGTRRKTPKHSAEQQRL